MDGGRESTVSDRDTQVKESYVHFGYFVSEFDCWVEVLDCCDEITKMADGHGGGTKSIIDVAFVEFRDGTLVLLQEIVFKVSHEQTSIAWTHFCSHGDTTDLFECVTEEGKGVVHENEFCKANQSGGGWGRIFSLVKEE